MKIGLVIARRMRKALDIAYEISKYLVEKGINVYVYPPTPKLPGDVHRLYRIENMDVDIAISIGGDGTVLRTFLFLPNKDTPVLGIGLGQRNFLSIADKSNYMQIINNVMRGEYRIREEMRLDVMIEGQNRGNPPVLNEVLFASRITGKTSDINLGIAKKEVKLLWRSKADGVIIATPIGSTAYAYSAGGPILDSDLESILVVPLVPVSRKPILILNSDRTVVTWAETTRSPPLLILDGQIRIEVDYLKKVYIRKSRKSAKFITVNGHFPANRLMKVFKL